ncbi:hypothetical protein QFZ82_002923 [Streptomyces sp. V4I23]|uniref:DUF3152 domain-containing protein n=1 Tax=Streptomyces sp. V4I23 TaxID=3042282 RepID=UPI0027811711|nr:DUF3152 domain-containing protein [Streptomyces sp. V4I23]MDQ1008438.1 hypothetical protein [Streptomyces sp. V4I23]
MGRHSRKGPAPKGAGSGGAPGPASGEREAAVASTGSGRRRRSAGSGPEQHTSAGTGPFAGPARGGHPEHHESGGGWGDWQTGTQQQVRTAPPPAAVGRPRIPGPRREFVEAFDAPAAGPAPDPYGPDSDPAPEAEAHGADEAGEPPAKGGKGRTFTGVAAAAVTTVLAVVVAGQVAADRHDSSGAQSSAQDRGVVQERPGRSDGRRAPAQEAARPPASPTYAQLMTRQFPIDPELRASGDFEAVPGLDRAPGKGRKIRYRIDVEKGLGLDRGLFARAVQETLNDERSWAHGGAMTFERISSGRPDFVITLASPGTTATWCAKSGLDTTVDNVSCDSASTERVMINAYRWAQGAETFGPGAMLAYRQMLINHEVGHRLGYNHVNCQTPGALAPVMQQQTKSLDIGGVACKPNPWVHPGE